MHHVLHVLTNKINNMQSNKILLCNPEHFNVTYSINPWMTNKIVNTKVAMAQWTYLETTIKNIGLDVKYIEPCIDLPDMVFTANAGIVKDKLVILSNFKYPQRQNEKDKFKRWFLSNNYNVHELDSSLTFEGAGDCTIVGDTLIAGYGFRTDRLANEKIAKLLNLKLINIKLVNENFYHLDTCLSIISSDLGIYFPDAFEDKNMENILQMELIKVSKYEAHQFACNSIVYKEHIIMPQGNNNISATLKSKGYKITEVNMSEFLKSGGAAQCLALWI